MNITGKFNLFVKEIIHNSNKPYSKKFSVSIGRKLPNGTYLNKYMSAAFSTEIMTDEVRAKLKEGQCYIVDVESGFITVDEWSREDETKVREFVLMITRAKINIVSSDQIG